MYRKRKLSSTNILMKGSPQTEQREQTDTSVDIEISRQTGIIQSVTITDYIIFIILNETCIYKKKSHFSRHLLSTGNGCCGRFCPSINKLFQKSQKLQGQFKPNLARIILRVSSFKIISLDPTGNKLCHCYYKYNMGVKST